MTENIWIHLKYAATLLSGFYGVYATLTDFKAGPEGSKHLTSKGYVGIVLLMLASSLGFVGDIHKDRKDKQDAKDQADEQRKVRKDLDHELQNSTRLSLDLKRALNELQMTSITEKEMLGETSLALVETKRLSAPIGSFEDFNLRLIIPANSPLLTAYQKRLSQAGKWPYFHVHYGDELFPNRTVWGEGKLSDLTHNEGVVATFTTKSPSGSQRMRIFGTCGKEHTSLGYPTSEVIGRPPKFYIVSLSCTAGTIERSAGLYSRYDLVGSTLRVELDSWAGRIDTSALSAAAIGITYSDGRDDQFTAKYRSQTSGAESGLGTLVFEGALRGSNSPHLQ